MLFERHSKGPTQGPVSVLFQFENLSNLIKLLDRIINFWEITKDNSPPTEYKAGDVLTYFLDTDKVSGFYEREASKSEHSNYICPIYKQLALLFNWINCYLCSSLQVFIHCCSCRMDSNTVQPKVFWYILCWNRWSNNVVNWSKSITP